MRHLGNGSRLVSPRIASVGAVREILRNRGPGSDGAVVNERSVDSDTTSGKVERNRGRCARVSIGSASRPNWRGALIVCESEYAETVRGRRPPLPFNTTLIAYVPAVTKGEANPTLVRAKGVVTCSVPAVPPKVIGQTMRR